MSRSSQVLVLILVLAVGAIFGALAAGGDDTTVGDLKKQIEALNARVAGLEKQILELKRAAPAAGNPAAEAEANQALSAIRAKMGSGDYTGAKQDMTAFLSKYGSTKAGRSAQRVAQELAVFGKDTPKNWGISKWYQGESDVNLDKGTTMLVFWETWCPHCKREVPKLQQIYTNYKDKGLQVVGLTKVTRSATDEGVAAFISEHSLGYPVAKEDGSLSAYFNVQGVPAAAVVKDGKIVWRGHPANLKEEQLKGWL